MVILISYDLKRPGQMYQGLYTAIQSYGLWWHYLDSVWLIETTQTPEQVFNHLVPYLDGNDTIFITQITQNGWGKLPQEAWNWLRQRNF